MDLAGRQEAHYAKNATYTTARLDLNVSNSSAEGYYTININSANASGFVLTAVARAQGGQNQDKIKRFRLRSNGRKQYHDGSTWKDGWSGY
ncbi:MAG: type IV pilin protein [Xanthomonadales bacterium]|nr:type IV pilin protein [Xanthomonadales bacterium]